MHTLNSVRRFIGYVILWPLNILIAVISLITVGLGFVFDVYDRKKFKKLCEESTPTDCLTD